MTGQVTGFWLSPASSGRRTRFADVRLDGRTLQFTAGLDGRTAFTPGDLGALAGEVECVGADRGVTGLEVGGRWLDGVADRAQASVSVQGELELRFAHARFVVTGGDLLALLRR